MRLSLRPNIQDLKLKVTDGITLAKGLPLYIQYSTNRGLLILNDLRDVFILLMVL